MDFAGILDGTEALVVECKYSEWGKTVCSFETLSTKLGRCNLFRCLGTEEECQMGIS